MVNLNNKEKINDDDSLGGLDLLIDKFEFKDDIFDLTIRNMSHMGREMILMNTKLELLIKTIFITKFQIIMYQLKK